jgi:hypothetical protein
MLHASLINPFDSQEARPSIKICLGACEGLGQNHPVYSSSQVSHLAQHATLVYQTVDSCVTRKGDMVCHQQSKDMDRNKSINPPTILVFKWSAKAVWYILTQWALPVPTYPGIEWEPLHGLLSEAPLPEVSNWGLPAHPKICCTSRILQSMIFHFLGLYTYVPLTTTECAGKLMPMQEWMYSTLIAPYVHSVNLWSPLSIPAWWIPMPI